MLDCGLNSTNNFMYNPYATSCKLVAKSDIHKMEEN